MDNTFETKLRALCIAYDNYTGPYIEDRYEGLAVFDFFMENGIDMGTKPNNENLKHEWDVSDRWRNGEFPRVEGTNDV